MFSNVFTRTALYLPLLAALCVATATASTITVTSSADSGAGTFRQAITDANSIAGSDTIQFDSAVTSITLTSAVLPSVTETLLIDGTVNHTAGTQVELNGNSLTGIGLSLAATNCEVYGMYIHGFTGRGIDSSASGVIIGSATKRNVVSANTSDGIRASSTGAMIEGNYIGTDTTGLLDNGNGAAGISATGATATIRGNVISGNATDGINAASTGLGIYGNTIGLGSDGATLIRNENDGIDLSSGATGAIIGTATLADRNIVSGNGSGTGFHGLKIAGATATIEGNYVGTDSTGLLDKGNSGHGLSLTAASPTVRGNVISGNSSDGINATSTGLGIYGNTIGLGSDGATLIRNENDGIDLSSAATGAIIGTATLADRNIVSGNGSTTGFHGIKIAGATATITNNYVGTDSTGMLAKGNGGRGISTTAATTVVRGNVISSNGNHGISATGTGLEVYGNIVGLAVDGTTLRSNASDGINLSSAATGAIIGTSAPADRNVVRGGGSSGRGIATSAANTTIKNNYSGTDVTGAVVLGTQYQALAVLGANCTVGGATAAEGNIAVGGTFGGVVTSGASGSLIERNSIHDNSGYGYLGFTGGVILSECSIYDNLKEGVWLQGTPGNLVADCSIHDNARSGVIIVSSNDHWLADNAIYNNAGLAGVSIEGRYNTVTGNFIFDNSNHGVLIAEASNFKNNLIQENSIYNNPGMAIAIGWAGPLANDALDVDTGANDHQNFPNIGPVRPGDANLTAIFPRRRARRIVSISIAIPAALPPAGARRRNGSTTSTLRPTLAAPRISRSRSPPMPYSARPTPPPRPILQKAQAASPTARRWKPIRKQMQRPSSATRARPIPAPGPQSSST